MPDARLHAILFATTIFTSLPRAALADMVGEVKALATSGRIDAARKAVSEARGAAGATPVVLEAMSWIARGELKAKDYEHALADASATRLEIEKLLAHRPLDAEKHLPIALGAVIEVHAQATAGAGERDKAVSYLQGELRLHAGTSIVARIQKNLHLLSLEGKPAPELLVASYLGPRPPSLAEVKGKVALLFFWAHWCGDCKATAPTIARLRRELAPRGLVVLAPTQPYGFIAGGEEAPLERETPYIEKIRKAAYSAIADVPAPYGQESFRAWGASTVPTIALIDRAGLVRLYHPGSMSYEELRPLVEQLLGAR